MLTSAAPLFNLEQKSCVTIPTCSTWNMNIGVKPEKIPQDGACST